MLSLLGYKMAASQILRVIEPHAAKHSEPHGLIFDVSIIGGTTVPPNSTSNVIRSASLSLPVVQV
jgi:hypothetical protein